MNPCNHPGCPQWTYKDNCYYHEKEVAGLFKDRPRRDRRGLDQLDRELITLLREEGAAA